MGLAGRYQNPIALGDSPRNAAFDRGTAQILRVGTRLSHEFTARDERSRAFNDIEHFGFSFVNACGAARVANFQIDGIRNEPYQIAIAVRAATSAAVTTVVVVIDV